MPKTCRLQPVQKLRCTLPKTQVCGTLKSSPPASHHDPDRGRRSAVQQRQLIYHGRAAQQQRQPRTSGPAVQLRQRWCASPPQQSRRLDHRTYLCLLQMMDVHGVMTCLLQRYCVLYKMITISALVLALRLEHAHTLDITMCWEILTHAMCLRCVCRPLKPLHPRTSSAAAGECTPKLLMASCLALAALEEGLNAAAAIPGAVISRMPLAAGRLLATSCPQGPAPRSRCCAALCAPAMRSQAGRLALPRVSSGRWALF